MLISVIILIISFIIIIPLAFWCKTLSIFTRMNFYKITFTHLLLLLGLFLILWAGRSIDIHQKYKLWQKVEAEISKTSVVGQRAVRPQLNYRYEYNNQLFSDSSSLGMPAFGGRNNRRETAKNILKEYTVGDKLPVYVNPENPSESRVKINIAWNTYIQLGLGFVFFTMAGTFILCAIFQKRKSESNA